MKVLTTENVLGFWNFAKEYLIKELEDQLMCYLAYHYAAIIKEEEFTELTVDNISIILGRKDLNADEETVYQSLMKWIDPDKPQRSIQLPKLIQKSLMKWIDHDKP